MIEAVSRAREAGVRTALVSNSWGTHRYPHELFSEMFDGVVISGQEGIRKPARRMYELGAQRAGADAAECVYVDDLPFNLTPAEELGMATVHHTERGHDDPRAGAAAGDRPARPRARACSSVALAPPVQELEHAPSMRVVRGLVREHVQFLA